MFLRRHVVPLLAATLSAGLVAAAPASAARFDPPRAEVTGFALVPGAVSTVVSVSPDVYFDPGSATYYLYTTGMTVGVYSSSDGNAWTRVTEATTPIGPYSDPSVVAVGDGSYRMYLTERIGTGRPCEGKQLRYATSTDLITWSIQPGVLLANLGCGVPDVVRTPTGYLLSYVRGDVGPHGVYQAVSSDGLQWEELAGIVTPTDMVDPSVVLLADGQWLMLTADFPSGKGPAPQKLYVATSTDGRTWDFGDETALYTAPGGQGAFDPDAVLLPDGTVRVWWAQGADAMTATVAAGTLTMPGPEPVVVVAPGRPSVKVATSRVTVSWTYAGDAGVLDGFHVQMRNAKGRWVTVREAAPSDLRANVPVKQVPVKKGRSLAVRVVAHASDGTSIESVASPVRTVTFR